ncbi:pirin family protein [Ralstonia soli]|uniref:Pirin family protein n=1 Tax=Ralstonia soli TaxID=2953896 RepID=A0ABT1AFH7_9RALS|nr:pirin family protein [Ralstonia soli]MCO5397135.1 pirin family protein [Ralstonia soli]
MTSIQHIIGPHVRDLGGFSVKRVLPSAARQTVGPFIFFDHMGPVDFGPGEGIDVRPHPHIGLATVTYLFDGSMVHRDSLGSVQTITPGDVNWMTAGNGIVHSERSSPEAREKGARMHGIQTWVALPKDQEKVEASFAHHAASTLPKLECPGVQGVVIAGDAFGLTSPVKVSSRTLYVALELAAGASLVIPPEHADRGLYLVEGAVTIDGEALDPHHLAVLEPGGDVTLTAQVSSRVMLLGGDPTDGHRHIYWNFVASDKADIDDAKQRWEADAFAHVPGETERIPLPPK